MRLLAGLLCAALVAGCGHPFALPRLTSNVVWDRDHLWFGGFSGIELSKDGRHATFVTDQGSLVQTHLIRGASGAVTGVQLLSRTPLKDIKGQELINLATDAEGLALGPDGTTYISFEQDHRVTRTDKNGTTRRLPDLPASANRQPNKGLESLAIHPDGTLYTLSENRPARNQPFKIWHLQGGTWTVAANLPRVGLYVPVGADFATDGRLYVLERAVTPLGFSSRIRRVTLTSPPDIETVLTTRAGRFDNLEGLSVWTGPQGHTRLTLIADDNFNSLQRTQIIEYTLP